MGLRERKAWKILAVVLIVIIAVLLVLEAVGGRINRNYNDMNDMYLSEAQAAGYDDRHYSCDAVGTEEIGSVQYSVYHSHREGLFGYSRMVYIRSDAQYRDETDGRTTGLRILCRDVTVSDGKVTAEPYLIWRPVPESVSWTFAILALLLFFAAIATAFAMIVYFIVYAVRSRRRA